MPEDKIGFLHKVLASLPIRSWKQEFFNILFPGRCVICAHPASDACLCAPCQNSIPIFSTLFCPSCERRIPPPRTRCCTLPKTSLRALGVASDYQNPVIKKAIWRFKYHGVKGLAEPLADILARYAKQAMLPCLADEDTSLLLIVPIPLHPRRERARGFNQARLLAKVLGEKLDLPAAELLQRTKFQKPQVEIGNLQKRKENIAGAFSLSPQVDSLDNKTIILLDDVSTTGSTLEEAGRTLRAAGAKKIYGLVVCKG